MNAQKSWSASAAGGALAAQAGQAAAAQAGQQADAQKSTSAAAQADAKARVAAATAASGSLAAQQKAAAAAEAASQPRAEGSEAIEDIKAADVFTYNVRTNRRVDGSNLSNGRYDNTGIAQCKINCDKDINCKGFVYDRPQNWCQLKSKKNPKRNINTRDFYGKVIPGEPEEEEKIDPNANSGPFAVTSKYDSHKSGTANLGNFWIQSKDCQGRKKGDKFVVTNAQGYKEVFTALAVNPNDNSLCLVQPDRAPPSVKLDTSPMLKWIVGDEGAVIDLNAKHGRCTQADLNNICVANKRSFGRNKDDYKFLGIDRTAKSTSRKYISGLGGVARCTRKPGFQFPGDRDFRTRASVYKMIREKCF
jgi:hypothetical protein